jgi:mRNA-binding protein PUF3
LIAAIQVRSNRATNMSASGMNSDRSRGPHAGMGKGFGAGKSSWNSNIWGDNNLGSGFDGELMDRARGISILSLPELLN